MGRVSQGSEQQRLIAGRYRLRGVLGQGAMGKVWEAYDEDLRRPVAVKEILLADGIPSAQADELRERTMREARATAMLSHPNVVTLYDVVRENGDPFVVMELVPGRSLSALLKEVGRLSLPQAAAVADAVASALQAAHTAGITHRDVKPGNVLVASDGRIKLTDFGIARNVAEQTLTGTGMMLGSPAYIAPEVAAGEGVSPSADLWGLGATLFAVVEGHAPYNPDLDVLQTLYQVVHGEVPRPRTTGPLADVIIGLMTKAVEARMSLVQVRRRIYPLLPEPGQVVFAQPTGNTTTVPAGAAPERRTDTLPAPFPLRTPATPAQVPMGQLARDPGPLPFTPTHQPPPPPARTGARGAVLVLAVILFLMSATAGFAGTRTLAGQPLLPRVPTQEEYLGNQPQVPQFAPRKAKAAPPNTQGGDFTISVPEGWPMFVEQCSADDDLPVSTKVHFVSPDGRFSLVVERFVGFYPKSRLTDYERTVSAENSGTAIYFFDVPVTLDPGGVEDGTGMEYSAPFVPGGDMFRATVAHVRPTGREDLWVVALTGPSADRDWMKTDLFDRINPTFSVTR
jgi:serine/threonine protein kinase